MITLDKEIEKINTIAINQLKEWRGDLTQEQFSEVIRSMTKDGNDGKPIRSFKLTHGQYCKYEQNKPLPTIHQRNKLLVKIQQDKKLMKLIETF